MTTPQPDDPSTTTDPWLVRPYRPGDEAALVDLFQRVFGRSISVEHWRWKLKTMPSPVENVLLAVVDEAPIFQYAGIPCRFLLPGGERIVMVSVDTMTSPDYRRRGLLTTVGDQIYDLWREAGVPFVLGLPNEKWGSRAEALGWKTLFPLRWLMRPLHPEMALARRLKLPLLSRLSPVGAIWQRVWSGPPLDRTITVRQVEAAGPEFDALWETTLSKVGVSMVRDSYWVNWRYLTAPLADYRVLLAERNGTPLGYAAYRLEVTPDGKTGFLAELSTGRNDAAAQNALIAHVVATLYTAGAEAIFTLTVPETPLYRTFQKNGFIFKRPSFVVQLVPLDPGLPLDLLQKRDLWQIAGGDFDVI